LSIDKLHVKYLPGADSNYPRDPRYYTLTHSDTTGELFLSIGKSYDKEEISGLYTRFMRDEVLAELKGVKRAKLHVYCHVSGGIVFGLARWRYNIFQSELKLVLQAIRFGDKSFFENNHASDKIQVLVNFRSSNKKYHKVEDWGLLGKYKI